MYRRGEKKMLVKPLTNETAIMWIGIAIAIIGIVLVVLICILSNKQVKTTPTDDNTYQAKCLRQKEIDKQIKALATIAITTKDTLDKLRDEQADLDKWLEAYKLIHKE